MLHEVLKQLVKDGYLVDAVATYTEAPHEIMDGVFVYHGKAYRDIDIEQYDIIVTQFSEAFKITPRAQKAGKKIIYIAHNTMEETNKYIHKVRPDLTIFNTEWVKAFHKYDGNSVVVHPPVYAHEHATPRTGDKITLINLTPAKGSNMFYNMAIKLPKFKFLGVEGGYWKEQQKYLRRSNVTFQKNTSNMKEDVWARTKVLLVPSVYESYGMVGVEAMASGIPVVACPTPGLKESLSYAGIFPSSTSIRLWKHELEKLMLDDVYYKQQSDLALQRSAELDPKVELQLMSKRVRDL